jgi:hypothetical protein
MAKTRYETVANDVNQMVEKLINIFPERFMHIKLREDVCLMFKDSPKSSWNAKTNVTNGLYRTLTGKKLIIQIWKGAWELDKPVDRALTLFRELSRIDLNEKNKVEYKLIKPDLNDFKFILEKIGLNHEKKDEFFKKVTTEK